MVANKIEESILLKERNDEGLDTNGPKKVIISTDPNFKHPNLLQSNRERIETFESIASPNEIFVVNENSETLDAHVNTDTGPLVSGDIVNNDVKTAQATTASGLDQGGVVAQADIECLAKTKKHSAELEMDTLTVDTNEQKKLNEQI